MKIGGKNIVDVVKSKYLDDAEGAASYLEEKNEVVDNAVVQASESLLLEIIQLEYAQISDLSNPTYWGSTLKYTKELRLDRNFLYSWD